VICSILFLLVAFAPIPGAFGHLALRVGKPAFALLQSVSPLSLILGAV
jgi:hypothetical protein